MERNPVAVGRPTLHGRGSECAVLDGMIAAVRACESRTLLVRGEAGIGKTALLDYAAPVFGCDGRQTGQREAVSTPPESR